MFGTVILANKPKTHADFPNLSQFSAALVDIYLVSRPSLTSIDGYLCQEGNGPSAGDVVKMNLILAGYDRVALDSVVCKIIGIQVDEIPYLKFAEQKGLGTTNFNQIEILGESIESVKRKFKKPKINPISGPFPAWLFKIMGKKVFKADIKFNTDKCKLYGTCWSNCPVSAIQKPNKTKKDKIPQWNKKNA